MCFMLLFRDLIRLFACYNDGIINLLEKYFDMNKKQCKDALDLYKKFLVRMDRVAEFLKVAEVLSLFFLDNITQWLKGRVNVLNSGCGGGGEKKGYVKFLTKRLAYLSFVYS